MNNFDTISYFLFFICLSFLSCAQEPLADTIDHCLFHHTELLSDHDTLLYDTGMGVTEWRVQGPDYKYPQFNPNNMNEIAFIKSYDLWLFDMCEGEKYLLQNDVSFLWDWSKRDWLLITKRDRNLYKIKSNGDSLTLLNAGGFNTYATWNPTGDKFMFLDNNSGVPLMDINGNRIDTMRLAPYGADWYAEDRVVSEYDNKIRMYDLSNNTSFQLDYTPYSFSYATISNTRYVPEKEIVVWDSDEYIFSTNITTKERSIIKKGSHSQIYHEFDISADYSTIVTIRSDMTSSPDILYIVEERKHLCLMNIDGTHERRILLDW